MFPIRESDKIDFGKPSATLDVNLVALRDPSTWPPEMDGLGQLEWNYFRNEAVELCVTPEAKLEITQGQSLASLGAAASRRFQKSRLFKGRPAGTTLTLPDLQANQTWTAMRHVLWPQVPDSALTGNQLADVSQLFFHLMVSGMLTNSAYLTLDGNFHNRAAEISSEFGISVMRPGAAWDRWREQYHLYDPTSTEVHALWDDQRRHFVNIGVNASTWTRDS